MLARGLVLRSAAKRRVSKHGAAATACGPASETPPLGSQNEGLSTIARIDGHDTAFPQPRSARGLERTTKASRVDPGEAQTRCRKHRRFG